MAIILNDNLQINTGKPVDLKYLTSTNIPYSAVTAVNNAISVSYRYSGLTVNILGEEYWYKNGITDGDLIPKSLGGGGTASGERIQKHIIQANSFTLGEVVGWSGGTYVPAIADGTFDGEVFGIVSESGTTGFTIVFGGYVTGLTSLGLSANTTYFLSDIVAGELSATKPTLLGHIIKPILTTTIASEALVFQYLGIVVQTEPPPNTRVVTEATGVTYTLDNTADFISVSGTTTTVNLPPSPFKGLEITIGDVGGNAYANNITVQGNGNNIEFGSYATINTNYGIMTLIYVGSFWKIISFA